MINAASGLRMFDFGTNCSTVARVDSRPFEETCNQAKYGQDDPPTYDLSHVTAKAAIMEGARLRLGRCYAPTSRGQGRCCEHRIVSTCKCCVAVLWIPCCMTAPVAALNAAAAAPRKP